MQATLGLLRYMEARKGAEKRGYATLCKGTPAPSTYGYLSVSWSSGWVVSFSKVRHHQELVPRTVLKPKISNNSKPKRPEKMVPMQQNQDALKAGCVGGGGGGPLGSIYKSDAKRLIDGEPESFRLGLAKTSWMHVPLASAMKLQVQ